MQNMDAEGTRVLKGRLITYLEKFGGYITYVFENLDSTNIFDKYIMCTRFPNWECPHITYGDIGFFKIKYVQAGKDTWYDPEKQKFIPYKYTDVHFLDFIFDKEKSEIVL